MAFCLKHGGQGIFTVFIKMTPIICYKCSGSCKGSINQPVHQQALYHSPNCISLYIVLKIFNKYESLTQHSDFGLSYAKNGELLKYIRKIGSFDETCTRFYTAEIVSALEYLHGKGIIHRYWNEFECASKCMLLSAGRHLQGIKSTLRYARLC